jgi:hypothetical protein
MALSATQYAVLKEAPSSRTEGPQPSEALQCILVSTIAFSNLQSSMRQSSYELELHGGARLQWTPFSDV